MSPRGREKKPTQTPISKSSGARSTPAAAGVTSNGRRRINHGARQHAQLPPEGVQGWRACPHAQPGCPTRGTPPAAARQLHLLTRDR